MDLERAAQVEVTAPAEMTAEELDGAFTSLLGCCLHSPVWVPADVDRVLCCVQGDQSGWARSAGWTASDSIGDTDSQSYTVVRLKNSTFGLLAESSDTTGHGCQCNAATIAYDSIGDLLQLGIVEDGARDLIRNLLAVPGAVVADSGELEAGTQRRAVEA